jgi:hypothetical protein
MSFYTVSFVERSATTLTGCSKLSPHFPMAIEMRCLCCRSHRDAQKHQLKGLDERRVRNLLADILETQIDGNLDLDRIREFKAEARALLTGDDGDAPLGH